MRQHIDDFLNSLRVEKGYSNNTIVAYRNDLGQFAAFLASEMGVHGWGDVTQADLIAYVNALRGEREYASATVARKVAAAKSFFHHLIDQGALKQDPSATLDSPKVRKYLPTAIAEDEVARLLKAPQKGDSVRGCRDSALLELLYATGMRVSEVVDLDVTDINLEESCVHCAQKSGRNKERVIPIHERAVAVVRQYLDESRPQLARDSDEQALFLNHRGRRLTRQGLWLIIKKYVDEVGIDPSVTPHTLRHSFATHLLNDGADVHHVQELLGHANVATTQVYRQRNSDKLQELYEEAPPRTQ